MSSDVARVSVRVTGTVQGVGFRPFVYSLAARLGLSGFVGNDSAGVFAEVEGAPAAVAEFLAAMERDPPPLARIDQVVTKNMRPYGGTGFSIAPSAPGARRTALVSADSATCADCLAELRDPADRRYAYPFINCTNCGPRFTIVADVPYDRPNTTMAPFAMCERCAAEYHDPANRRFHAQPVCCPACGPRLSLRGRGGAAVPAGDPLAAAAALLRDGGVLAVKGLGGYHLAVAARIEAAAAALPIEEARIIVAGGRGVGGEDGFKLVQEIADQLGGAVGATRAAVDSGWIPYAQQIGQTGKIVKPQLYLALGISGAIQHKVGMQTAGTIIGVNRDPDAPIAEFADLVVVGDLFEVGKALLEALRARS